MASTKPALAVLSTLFPSAQEPGAGPFIRERMFRVGRRLPVTIIAPQPWFPLQGLIRRWKPNYRPDRLRFESMDGFEVHRPRFLSPPGLGRRFDGFFVALAALPLLRRLVREGRADIIDAHFGYPDGHAASLLARWCGLPMAVTLRGKENRLRHEPPLRKRMAAAMRVATRVIAVSDELRKVAIELGATEAKTVIVGNGVDLDRFQPVDKAEARAALGLGPQQKVLVSVGWLVEGKGFHRVLRVLPSLVERHPDLVFLIVGGVSAAEDYSAELRRLTAELGLEQHVRFLGAVKPDALRGPLSAADLFVLATTYEGWANVFLEAMACGQPVVATRVGGNPGVVCRPELGTLVPLDDGPALEAAIEDALAHPWDREAIRRYAAENAWDRRVDVLCELFAAMARGKTADS